MTPVILRHRGTINEFIGDAILVLFGAPFERPDDAERAVRCAWAMQQAMVGFNAESRAQGLPELTMGVAVHSGRVVAGNIGSQDHMKYGVVGPAVNLAGRMESLTVGPQVLLSEATLERVRPLVTVGPGSQVAVKGVPEPVTVYELRGVAGEEGQTVPAGEDDLAEVDLAAGAHAVLEGKRVDETPHPVRVIRLGRGAVEFVAGAALTQAHSDLKLVLDLGPPGPVESYVRVAAREPFPGPDGADTRIRAVFTSLAEADRERIERRVGGGSTENEPA
jgi:adenylate cyclase